MKKILSTVGVMALVAGAYLTISTINTSIPVAKASSHMKSTYAGTLYVAGMGGHFSKADVTIDPNNAEAPITVNSVEMVDIGGVTHPTHDARIDVNDRNTMFWSTYKLDSWKEDPEATKKATKNIHVGKTDLKTGAVVSDVAVPVPDRAAWTGANYCASGQSASSYIPVSMANEGYIDVFDKATLTLKHRVFFDDLGIKAGETTFAHGMNTPDMKKFLLTVNDTPEGHTKWTGNTKLMYLDMEALEQGKINKLAEGMITGKPGSTITFRQYFTNDGKYLLQSGADRGYLIDAETLKVLDEITPLPGENHDIIPTPDGKYAVMTLREKANDFEGKESVDGTVLLYDIEARKTVGKSASVCFACHKGEGIGKAILCGLDANWK